jgi:hypothetical protein
MEGQMSCTSTATRDLTDDVIDLPEPAAANDNVEDSFDNLALEVVAILLADGRDMLAG